MLDTFPVYEYNRYRTIEDELERIKTQYKKKFKKIKLNYNKFSLTQTKKKHIYYNKILNNCFKKLLNLFPEIKENDVLIYFHGSFSRETNSLFSDIDLTFCYDNSLRNTFIPVEEILAITLIDIFNLGYRCKIHPLMNNFDNLYKEDKPSKITFKFGDESVCYDDSIYKFMDVYKAVNSSRSIDDLMEVFEKKLSNVSCDEFCYSYKQIYCNSPSLDYSNNINELEKRLFNEVKKEDILFMLDDAEKLIIKSKDDLNKLKNETIIVRDLKSAVKDQPNFAFYKIISILRRYLNRNFDYKKGVSLHLFKEKEIAKILPKRTIKNVYDKFYTKNWYLNKFQKFLIDENIKLSHMNTTELSIPQLSHKYKNRFNSNFNEIADNMENYFEFLLELTSLIKENIWKNM